MVQFTAQEIILSFLCPSLGSVTGLAMFAAPIQSVREANRRGKLGHLNPTPWSMMLGNCAGWVAYSYLYVLRYWSTGGKNPVDLTGAVTLLVPNASGLVISIWLNLCAAKLQYHDRLAGEMRKSITAFVAEHEEDIRRRSMIEMAESQADYDVEAADADDPAEEEKEEDMANLEVSEDKNKDKNCMANRDEFAYETNDLEQQNRLAELGKLILQVTTQEKEIPAPHERSVVAVVIFWLVVITLIAFLPLTQKQRELFIGVVVNCNLVFFYAAPLSTIVTVLKTRNSISIHRPSMITATLNGVFWGAFGIATLDLVIAVPNSMGAILGFVQIALCVLFPRREKSVD